MEPYLIVELFFYPFIFWELVGAYGVNFATLKKIK